MDSTPKISVIMPSLNVGDYMDECLSSVLNQSFNDIEIICVDAGSTDNTLKIIEKYQETDDRIKIINSDKKSYGHQVNLGLKEAKGTYISIVETDDYIDGDMLKNLYSRSEGDTIEIIKGNFNYLNDYDAENIEIIKDTSKKGLVSDMVFTLKEQPLFIEGHPSIWAGIYLKEFLDKNNIKFKEVPKGGWVDNPFFYESAIKAQKIIYFDEPVYFYRVTNPNSSSNDLSDNTLPMKRILDIYEILEENEVKDQNIILYFYNRLFRYIEIILENNGNDINSLGYEDCCYIQKVLEKVDENIVQNYLKTNFRLLYYKFMSPLLLRRFDSDGMPKYKENKITRIGTLGSCVSRDGLRSYYNNYREKYEIVFSEQRISFISLMYPPTAFDESQFVEDIDPVNAMFMRKDFEKNFFKEINKGIEYLIIDFVFDVKYGILKFNDSFITGSRLWDSDIWGLENTRFYKENVSKLEHFTLEGDFDYYFSLWCESFDKFYNYMKTNFPNVTIILTESRFVNQVLKKNGIIGESNPYFKQHSLRLNPLSKKLEGYVENKYEDIEIIPFPEHVLADENHICGLGSEHYNRMYYEYFYKKLNSIVEEN